MFIFISPSRYQPEVELPSVGCAQQYVGKSQSCMPQDPPKYVVEAKQDPPEYVVEAIVGKRREGLGKKKGTKYLIRWEGYGEADDTWESTDNLANALEKVDKYERDLHVTELSSRCTPVAVASTPALQHTAGTAAIAAPAAAVAENLSTKESSVTAKGSTATGAFPYNP